MQGWYDMRTDVTLPSRSEALVNRAVPGKEEGSLGRIIKNIYVPSDLHSWASQE